MASPLITYIRTIVSVVAFGAALSSHPAAYGQAAATQNAAMPAAQQNALVQKYCAVCHTDAHLNGGLSLQHFDAARPDPGIAAMIVSKLTSLSPKQVSASQQQDPGVATIIASKMKTGAMGAAGVPVPDRPTQLAFLSALSSEAAGAGEWTVNRIANGPRAPMFTTSIVQEIASPTNAGDTDMYRLTLTCRADTNEAEMQLAWSPGSAPAGTDFSVSVDGKTALTYRIESGEKQFKGAVGTMGTGAVLLHSTPPIPLPVQALAIKNLFPNETVVFPFDRLPQAVRSHLSNCFSPHSQ
jgi:hypothetical protein